MNRIHDATMCGVFLSFRQDQKQVESCPICRESTFIGWVGLFCKGKFKTEGPKPAPLFLVRSLYKNVVLIHDAFIYVSNCVVPCGVVCVCVGCVVCRK